LRFINVERDAPSPCNAEFYGLIFPLHKFQFSEKFMLIFTEKL
jgi:hypothetical protein